MEQADRTVADLGERALIARIQSRLPNPPPWVLVGIGSDAAVLEPARNTVDVITTDVLVEGVHFDRAFASAHDIGFKALAVSLSDLAAVGAAPRAVVLSLVLPGHLPATDVDGLIDGLQALAGRHGVALVGGNIARSPGPLVVDLTALGSAHRRRILMRSGAAPGDDLYVTGSIGAAAAGLQWLQRQQPRHSTHTDDDSIPDECVRRFLTPEPRVRAGGIVARNRAATACIDLSDGLGAAVHQLAEASGTGAVLDAGAIPVDPAAARWFAREGRDPLDAALRGGEDYELLFAVRPRFRRRFTSVEKILGVPVTCIGVLTPEGIVLKRDDREAPLPGGFEHFSNPESRIPNP